MPPGGCRYPATLRRRPPVAWRREGPGGGGAEAGGESHIEPGCRRGEHRAKPRGRVPEAEAA